jgi:hypothetical protein
MKVMTPFDSVAGGQLPGPSLAHEALEAYGPGSAIYSNATSTEVVLTDDEVRQASVRQIEVRQRIFGAISAQAG